MFKFVLNELNYKSLLTLVKTIKKSGVDKLEIEVTKNQDNLPHFFKIIPFIYEILDYEKFFEIWLKDFPYCVINEFSRDHILPVNTNNSIEKIDTCSKCKFYTICSGFPQGYFDKYNEINNVYPILIKFFSSLYIQI